MLHILLSFAIASAGSGVPLVQRAGAVPPPPRIPNDRPVPRIVYAPSRTSGPPIVLDLQVSADGQTLLNDTIRVGRHTNAMITQHRSEAPAQPCPNVSADMRSNETSFRIGVHFMGGIEPLATVAVDVNWSRPASSDGCPHNGNRAVTLEQAVELAPRQEIWLRGDGGLAVRIRRR